MRTRLILLSAVLLVITARFVTSQSNPEIVTGRQMRLADGPYVVQRIDGPITLLVSPKMPTNSTADSRPFAVKLASLKVNPSRRPRSRFEHAYELTRLVRGGTVYLRFDRQRFDQDQLPIAYVFAQDRLVNAELVACGAAIPKSVPGNSPKLQRLIRLAAKPADGRR